MPDTPLTPARADPLFQTLADAHDGLSEADSAALNARLVLLMAAAIGDLARLQALCRRAAASTGRPAGS